MGEKDIDKIWKETLKKVEERLNNSRAYDVWIKPVQIKEFTGNTLKIKLPNTAFQRGFITFENMIKEEFAKLTGFYPDFVYCFDEEEKKSEKTPIESSLNPEYTFENFVVGPCNRLAHAAALAVSQSPGVAYNPLFLYGGVGLGKTHLMQAIGHFVKDREDLRIAYIPSEFFVNEFIKSIQNKTTYIFRNKFRNLDFLLIDDIHFIAGKEGTQEEFFHTFNFLYNQKKQIILSSDRPPKEITYLEKRLISRFEWGLVVDLQPPDFETRVAILKKKCEIKNFFLSDEIIFYIAERIKDNIRKLEGVLNRLFAYTSLMKIRINKNMVDEVLERVYNKEGKKVITLNLIMKKVCEYFKISPDEIKSKKRIKSILIPRQIAMFLGRELTENSLNSIAYEFGGKDHTTVLHACRKIKDLIEKDEYIKRIVENIKESLYV